MSRLFVSISVLVRLFWKKTKKNCKIHTSEISRVQMANQRVKFESGFKEKERPLHAAWNSNGLSHDLRTKTRAGSRPASGWLRACSCLCVHTETHAHTQVVSVDVFEKLNLQCINAASELEASAKKTLAFHLLFHWKEAELVPCLAVCARSKKTCLCVYVFSFSGVLVALPERRCVPAAQHLLMSRGLDGPTLWGA